uniref:Ig-like domain-containing protein n=1 Tax=Oreochromis aureus TaxID=47969 RepID=A0AAZ1X470_OREAU
PNMYSSPLRPAETPQQRAVSRWSYYGRHCFFSIKAVSQMESNPVYSGDTATLECSVFSDSENKTCPGDHNVFWFRAGSHPNIIYTDRKRDNEYENRYHPQKRCVYRFSKNVSSSDAGTYYCAVAACGEIISGNGTILDIQGASRKYSYFSAVCCYGYNSDCYNMALFQCHYSERT